MMPFPKYESKKEEEMKGLMKFLTLCLLDKINAIELKACIKVKML